ncbi:hypothetical protein A2533_01895 [Candidatus Falkowbacteria bacterium RIFOXYD2_FULL_35_9]|uniref:DUF3048 domain-containing protein n=1 Tax=Candidatus Falkowbacteria bacterium RIFOXYC2_FULL_36_12 TaxID=1798002 RepID=A0A1F5SYJ7_9BACT|nr:MAG: hypothetical protein A2300_01625 [Candidatus Falkowbacteria bacterium RIFOXYB2_FULL_35_7]OGF31798.1 MAG: hypothetical protein A2478_04925 [Candidatus Falkowbacteria bacterium RIFOXYC2_FULL_36_12]OGF33792.1 MAG: hypothetical protein A2223_00265 [Candidatus Falkowbacteria bacterium RIFOXYA2_FULL_35_8]OGF48256.1 MAG: hypothetical protein A2533_01895 [Candidatus Falkowbacteria bacterium RIFOXYD2_FULL_35_9]
MEKLSFSWKRNLSILPLIIFIFVIMVASIYLVLKWPNNTDQVVAESPNNTDIENKCQARRKLDGLCLSDTVSESFPVVVMIDNHTDANPPSGLSQASLVYEAIAEGSITRLVAVFDSSSQIEEIGPIRSARPYFVDWASEFKAVYVHVGGSDEALTLIPSRNIYDLNEFSNGGYFWRDIYRFAPHNSMTSMALVTQATSEKGWDEFDQFDSWIFKADAGIEDRGQVLNIKIDFGQPSHEVDWTYDSSTNSYLRSQAGLKYLDSDRNQLSTKNLVIMYSESKIIDDYGRRFTETIGSGNATIFLDGRAIDGVWQRDSVNNRTRFFDVDNHEINFNAGPTWIEVVPDHFPPVEY